MARLTRAAAATLVLGAGLGCAGLLNPEFGEQGMPHHRFVELDSALGMVVGSRVLIRAQQDLGQDRPASGRPNVVGFRGTLLGLDDGWVHLLRGGDSVRVGKGSVVGAWRLSRRPLGRWPGVVVSALITGGVAFAIMETQNENALPSQGAQTGIVIGSAVFGGLLGSLIWGGDGRGEQIYPMADPQEQRDR